MSGFEFMVLAMAVTLLALMYMFVVLSREVHKDMAEVKNDIDNLRHSLQTWQDIFRETRTVVSGRIMGLDGRTDLLAAELNLKFVENLPPPAPKPQYDEKLVPIPKVSEPMR